ncbi:hypothetical protein AV521_31725 [Streptomyces sp. IMTB 2501]|nr:hypothetical protein AV521_31725 [Streptomyces sp. IMTB 2501]
MKSRPRHAARRKPLFNRFQMSAGKTTALVAMPTAVIMGMSFMPSLASADSNSSSPSSKSLTADEYKNCVAALKRAGVSASPSPSDRAARSADKAATPEPSATSSSSSSGSSSTSTPSTSASHGGGLLDTISDAIRRILGGGSSSSGSLSTTTPSATTSGVSGEIKDTTKTVKDTSKAVMDTVSKSAQDARRAVKSAANTATSSPNPSVANCPTATSAASGVGNKVPVAQAPWYLQASSLLLKGADYQGIVDVKTASGTTKKALKFVVSGGIDIGNLHQIVKDHLSGKTYHVQAAAGSTSTIRNGATTLYTESISGNLFGLIPVTFSPSSPPPLNIPVIYFTKVKVTQAAQFGGTLRVPGLHSYQTS